jgi:hypothetical protein
MEAIIRAIIFAILNRSEALAARARTSVSMVADADAGVDVLTCWRVIGNEHKGGCDGCDGQCSTFGCVTEKGGGETCPKDNPHWDVNHVL